MYNTNYSKFNKDLSKVDSSLAHALDSIIKSMSSIKDIKSLKSTTIDAIHPFVNHGISLTTFNNFKNAIDSSITMKKVQDTIVNFYLAGSGLGLGRGL